MGEYCELYRVEEAVIRQLIEQESYEYFDEHYAWYGGKYHDDPTRHFILSKAFRELQDVLNRLDPSEDKVLAKAILGAPHFIAAAWDSPRYNLPAEVKKINQALGQIRDGDLPQSMQSSWVGSYAADANNPKLVFGSHESTTMKSWAQLREAYACAGSSGDGIVINML